MCRRMIINAGLSKMVVRIPMDGTRFSACRIGSFMTTHCWTPWHAKNKEKSPACLGQAGKPKQKKASRESGALFSA